MTQKQKPTLTAPKWLKTVFKLLEICSPFLASRLASRLFFTPIRFKTPAIEQKIYEKAVRSSLMFQKQRIKLYEWGTSNKGVLLVHGWAGRATQVGHLAQPLVDAGFKVYAFDAPAHGYSSGKQTNLMEFTELIKLLVKKNSDIHSIIGHSMGGTASIYGLYQGVKISKCVIIGTPAYTDWILSSFCKQINVSAKVEHLIKTYIENKFNKSFEELNNSSMVKTLKTKGLILHCKDDVDCFYKDAVTIHENWKNSTLVLTKNLGHRRILRNTDTTKTIVEFLKS